ncbi:MAG: hypothetical protein LBO03_06185 [Acidaminococcales bacterium]|jgi:YbbR domain-containing protein|nr:hypothetical protein [Acidaminococcales bacterium]
MRLPKRLPHNSTLVKALSVIAAFVLWLYVMNEQNPSISRTYALELEKRNLPANLVVTDDFADIRVKVSGPRYVLANVSVKDIKAYVDLQDINKGSHDRKVWVVAPPELQLDEVTPDVVSVVTDTLVSRDFPVAVRFSGQGAPELSIVAAAVDPDTVQAQGAARLIGNITKVEAVLNIDSALASKGRYKLAARLNALDKDNNAYGKVALTPDGVIVTVDVADRIITKTVPVKAGFTGPPPGAAPSSQALLTPLEVKLTGPFAQLAQIEEVFTEKVVLDKLPAGPLLLEIKLPPGVTADTDRATVVFAPNESGQGT